MQARQEQPSIEAGDRVVDRVHQVLDDLNADLPAGLKLRTSSNSVLYGPQGQLDSLGLVHLIVAVEQKVEEELGVTLTLADERAMSERHSPFATVGSLTAYVQNLLEREIRGFV